MTARLLKNTHRRHFGAGRFTEAKEGMEKNKEDGKENMSELQKPDLDLLEERFSLAKGRIHEIYLEAAPARTRGTGTDGENRAALADYWRRTADFVLKAIRYYEDVAQKNLGSLSLKERQDYQGILYQDILGDAYEKSFANPEWAAGQLGRELGQLLSFLYMELRNMILFGAESRLEDMVICCEIFLEIYGILEDGGDARQVHDALYYFVSDYCDVTVDYRVQELLDPGLSFARDIVMESDLADLRYLYRYGDFIGKEELDTAAYLNSLPQETVEGMARTLTEGYRKGFELANIDLSKKKYADVRYCIGFERVVREVVKQLGDAGLSSVIYRSPVHLINRRDSARNGYHGTSANRQCDYDHRCDLGLFLDGDLKERRLSVYRQAFASRAELAAGMAGPAVIEIFGEESTDPANKPEAVSYSPRQLALLAQMLQEMTRITYQYINGEERSFSIISYPVPAIGEHFKEIFAETIRLNNLDNELYKKVHQVLIDALDTCERAQIRGRNGNETCLSISLHKLEDPGRQSNFENCLADVNIPLGEVFTSPTLKGTSGRLHVKELFIGGIGYKNIWFEVRDGMVADCGCDNFPTAQEGHELVKEKILNHHESLPMGEFAIGTNTLAYRMAKKYGIFNKLKILIAEKTGAHFAFGDTCYSNSEERRVYNPDGKELVAKDNEVSILRKTAPEKAYFGCHTDITLPYDELDTIVGIRPDGSEIVIAENGRFVLPGCEELNKALEEE